MGYYDGVKFSELLGKTLTKIELKNDDPDEREEHNEIYFITDQGETYLLYHEQDCCENVYLADTAGDINDLMGSPILLAEEVSNREDPPPPSEWNEDSYTWTFYKLSTIKGSVTFRWYGESNGYYSEEVNFKLYSV
jgi:hypothetical protein